MKKRPNEGLSAKLFNPNRINFTKGESTLSVADNAWLMRELLDFPFLPTPPSVVEVALELVDWRRCRFFADLGCGDAAVLIQAAKKSDAFCVGFEIDPRLLPEAKRNIQQSGLNGRIDVVHADLFTVDLSRFDVLYVYPYPTISKRIAEMLYENCGKGAVAVVCDYPLPTLEPAETPEISGSGLRPHRIYLYRF